MQRDREAEQWSCGPLYVTSIVDISGELILKDPFSF